MNIIDKMWKDRKAIRYFNIKDYENYLDTIIVMAKNPSTDIKDLLEKSLYNLKHWESSFIKKNEFVCDVLSEPCYSFYQEFVSGIKKVNGNV